MKGGRGGEGGRGEGRRHSKKVGCTTICQKRWPLDLEKLKRYLKHTFPRRLVVLSQNPTHIPPMKTPTKVAIIA